MINSIQIVAPDGLVFLVALSVSQTAMITRTNSLICIHVTKKPGKKQWKKCYLNQFINM